MTRAYFVLLGAGQGGLTLAARLKQLNVSTLVIDRNDRVGDNWRNRYHQLVLHDSVWYFSPCNTFQTLNTDEVGTIICHT